MAVEAELLNAPSPRPKTPWSATYRFTEEPAEFRKPTPVALLPELAAVVPGVSLNRYSRIGAGAPETENRGSIATVAIASMW
jgi:hypothetical protein